MSVIGIDPSLLRTGYAMEGGEVGTISPPKGVRGPGRLMYIRDAILSLLDEGVTFVAYEGYAMGRFAGRAFDLGELGGVLKVVFWERKLPFLIVPPSSLKLFATGKGNADKSRVCEAMSRHRGGAFRYDDEADAYALLQMGLLHLDPRRGARDRRHYTRTALNGCVLVSAAG